jgi:enamine deaminase RidA (YjgF/YER057c/UK114 family)
LELAAKQREKDAGLRMNDRTLDDLLEAALEPIMELQAKSEDEQAEWLKGLPWLPASIPLGDGRQIFTTEDGLKALHDFGLRWRAESDLKLAIGAQEAAQLAVNAFGELLAGVGLSDFEADISLKKSLKDLLHKRLQALTGTLAHYFPLQLFDKDLPRFSVGPVNFMTRVDWLTEVEGRADHELPWISIVRDYWEGRGPKPESPRTKQERLPGLDDWTAYNIVDTFGEASWAAVVEVSGKERLRSKACSEIAVRVALDSLGLALSPTDARDLRGPGDQKQRRLDRHFSQAPGLDVSYSSRVNLPRFKTTEEHYDAFIKETDALRRYAGQALQDFVSGSDEGKAALHRRWVEAMYWYGQALREPMEFIGLVHAGVALDVLAKGSYDSGITELCSRLIDVHPDKAITQNGLSLRKVVQLIYKEGRSQFSHGGRLALLSDLPYGRDDAVHFTSIILAEYAAKLSMYGGQGEYRDFLAALPTLKAP